MSIEEIIAEAVRREMKPLLEKLERLSSGVAGDELLRVSEAATLAKVKPATIRKWIRAGHLEAKGKARGLRVSRADVLSLKHEPKPSTESAEDTVSRLLGKAS